MSTVSLLKRVSITNYKSIQSCDVSLGPLTFLVGLNGSGKSNFIDALRFCRDALRGTLEHAFSERRASLRTLTHFSSVPPGFSMGFNLELGSGEIAYYGFSIGQQSPRGFHVEREECAVGNSDRDKFVVRHGRLLFPSSPTEPGLLDDRLFLVQASGRAEYRPVYDFLSNLEFYNPEPGVMKPNFDTPGPGDILEPDGVNAANVLERLAAESPDSKERIAEYMRRILPDLNRIEVEDLNQTYKYLQFVQGEHRFFAEGMSDGTLRSLAILIALFQRNSRSVRPSVVSIEEPEAGLHPAASRVLLSALIEASRHVQVLVTTHSADLLDTDEVEPESVRAVESVSGSTRIGDVDDITKQALQMKLYSTGELMRMNKVRPGGEQADVRGEEELLVDRPS